MLLAVAYSMLDGLEPKPVPPVDGHWVLVRLLYGFLAFFALCFLLFWVERILNTKRYTFKWFPIAVLATPLCFLAAFGWTWFLGYLVLLIVALLRASGQVAKERNQERKVREAWTRFNASQNSPRHTEKEESYPPDPLPAHILQEKRELIQRLEALRAMTVANGCTRSEANVAHQKASKLQKLLSIWPTHG